MSNTPILKPDELLEKLELLREKNYIFRGLPNTNFLLQPSVFRTEGIKKLEKEFIPFHIFYKWLFSKKIQGIISNRTQGEWSINHPKIWQLYYISIYTMMYNYALANYIQHVISNNHPHISVDAETQKFYSDKPIELWTEEEVFQKIFRDNLYFLLLGAVDLNGNVLQESVVPNNLTCADEGLPQHYGIPTAALDWTLDPYIAIFFALRNIPKDSKFISIYVYKQIVVENSPIIIKECRPDTKNQRCEAQKGKFTAFQYACTFYHLYNKWPSIENYHAHSANKSFFDLVKYDIALDNTDELRKILKHKNITEQSLCLDKDH